MIDCAVVTEIHFFSRIFDPIKYESNTMFHWTEFIQQVIESSFIEWMAVLSSVVYVILAARNNILCWAFALISSVLYIYICYDYKLYLESGLQSFYFIMAIVGWVLWRKSNVDGAKIQRWSISNHAINILISGTLTLLLGFLFSKYTDQASPYVDAFTTCFSLTATYLVTKRVLGNWIYWIIIDIISIYLYAGRELYLSSVLYLLFTILAIIGFITWQRKFNVQSR